MKHYDISHLTPTWVKGQHSVVDTIPNSGDNFLLVAQLTNWILTLDITRIHHMQSENTMLVAEGGGH
jgi:hypothetical protein